MTASWARVRAPSLRRALSRWNRTVSVEMPSVVAICASTKPWTRSDVHSRSRKVSGLGVGMRLAPASSSARSSAAVKKRGEHRDFLGSQLVAVAAGRNQPERAVLGSHRDDQPFAIAVGDGLGIDFPAGVVMRQGGDEFGPGDRGSRDQSPARRGVFADPAPLGIDLQPAFRPVHEKLRQAGMGDRPCCHTAGIRTHAVFGDGTRAISLSTASMLPAAITSSGRFCDRIWAPRDVNSL